MTTPNPGERKNTFVSDQPSPLDYLDFQPYVSGLVDVITARETQTPLTLGISGSWGSGKTTLMNLMEKEALARVRKEKGRTLKCLWVNVWQVSQHGEGGQALLQALFTKVRSRLSLLNRISFGWFLFRDRINYRALMHQFAVNSYRILIVIAPLVAVRFVDPESLPAKAVDEGRLSAGISVLLGLWLILKPMVEAAREKVSLDLGAVLEDAPYENKVSALQKLQAHFERLVSEWVGQDGRLVVFIDDLDRCSPDSIADTLEALKLFATTERCVYVLGLDQDVVARSIQTKYKSINGEAGDGLPLEGVRYLEKIVQLPFLLPQIEVTDIRGYVESFNAAWPHGGCADIFIEGLPPNPRQLKRAVNVFFLLWQLAESRREKLGPTVTALRLAKVVALQTAHPDLFEWFKRAPYLLKELEVYYQRGPEEQKLVEDNLEEGKRLTAVAVRPGLKRLFELHRGDPLAMFGDLELSDLSTFFSLTRSVTLSGVSPGGGATVKGEPPTVTVNTQGEAVSGVAVGGSRDVGNSGETDIYAMSSPPVSSLHQLPPPPRDFTGRETQLSEIMSKIESEGVAICSVQGLGGVGKTAFALKLAERLTPRYPDAQFYLDLKGTSETPLAVADALSHVIRAFYATARLPEDVMELITLYRSVLHGRRALLFMDNAAGREQVEPLLPPESCVLLVTSRQHFTLPGLFALNLEMLLPADARELLLKIAPRTAERADEIAQLCGYLPLALRLAASAIAERVNLSPDDYVRRLSDAKTRLSLVEASLTLSYELLSPELQTLWRPLAVFPTSFDAQAAAAVWELEPDAAQDRLGEIIKYSLLEWDDTTGRYRLHDAARLFADSRLSEPERSASRMRHAVHYLTVLQECEKLYLQGGESLTNGLALFDAERRNIEAGHEWSCQHASEGGKTAELCNIYPEVGTLVLSLRQHPRERIFWLEAALAAARQLADRAAEGRHSSNLGLAYGELGEVERAVELYKQALSIAHETSDRRGEGNALANLGIAYHYMGELTRAVESHEQALAIAREISDRLGEGRALGNLGIVYSDLGELRRAVELYEQNLIIAREIGDRRGEGNVLGNLGIAYKNLGETRRAVEFYEQALAIAREIGDRLGEGIALLNTSLTLDEMGNRAQAIAQAETALKIFEQIESPQAESARELLKRWRGEA